MLKVQRQMILLSVMNKVFDFPCKKSFSGDFENNPDFVGSLIDRGLLISFYGGIMR